MSGDPQGGAASDEAEQQLLVGRSLADTPGNGLGGVGAWKKRRLVDVGVLGDLGWLDLAQ